MIPYSFIYYRLKFQEEKEKSRKGKKNKPRKRKEGRGGMSSLSTLLLPDEMMNIPVSVVSTVDPVVKTEDNSSTEITTTETIPTISPAPTAANKEELPWVKIKKEIEDMTQRWRDLQKLVVQGKKESDEAYALSLRCKRDIAKCLRYIERAKNGEPINKKRKSDRDADEEDEKEFGRFGVPDYAQAPQTKKRKSSQQQQQAEAYGEEATMQSQYAGQDMGAQYAQYQQKQQQMLAQMAVKENPAGGGLKPGRRVFVYSNNDKNYILAKVMSYDNQSKSYMVIDADKDSRNSFMVSENYVTPLPKVPLLNLEPGTRVMALYHPSTCFYQGVVTQKARNNVKNK